MPGLSTPISPRASTFARALRVSLAFALLTFYVSLLRIRPSMVLRRTSHSMGPALILDSSRRQLDAILSAVLRAASLHPARPQCLPQSLAAATMLRWAGEQPLVVIGVSKQGNALDAHAWVEIGGHCNDAARNGFAPLTELR